jgi:hypothetical protein
MTIAACYVSKEGVVLGADSTTTYSFPNNSFRHYNNAQKIFEIGELGSSLALVTWGMGGLPERSYRQLAAELSDDLISHEPPNVVDVADRWNQRFWTEYSAQLAQQLQRVRDLEANSNKTPVESKELERLLQNLFVGFCIGGHVRQDRSPMAYELLYSPANTAPPAPTAVVRNQPLFWGVPNMMDRLLSGIDRQVFDAIRTSPHWLGSQADLENIIRPHVLNLQLELPLREAIDWIFSSLFITIKALKFSSVPPFCGGPIEVATITADRRFRWVCHKGLDQALSDHAARGVY